MKIVSICTGWVTHIQYILDNEKADAAYKAIKEAVDGYDKYSNDKQKTISVDVGDGNATYRIDLISMVNIEDCALSETTIIERAAWEAKLKAKIAERLAPSEQPR